MSTVSFYQTYKEEHPEFGNETLDCASQAIAKLIDTATSSERPGMLLGKVQSGKTRTFISILAGSFDRGFDAAIVLSKNSTALIQQTVKRLQSEFSTFTDDGAMEIYDIMSAPTSYTQFELEAKHIFVAKKQKDNLRRLIDLFSKDEMRSLRVLIIDDEADNASVGYAMRQGDVEATTIASLISQLRDSIEQVSFLQVTATPYSLYLQPSDIDVANHASFKPTRPAFTELVPVPLAYVGGDTYFGEAAQSEDPTVERCIHHVVDHREFEILKTPDRRRLRVEDCLTSPAIRSYRHAIVNFIVGGTIQRMLGIEAGENPRTLRYSFLVHSEASRGAHSFQEELTTEICGQLRTEAASESELFNELIEASYEDLDESIRLSGQSTPSLDSVKSSVRDALDGGHVTIVKVNSDEQVATMLDSTGQLKLRSPLNIFIGGQVLDRGVTLAKLIGFYYGRRPQRSQQDTVLQHSRMYGYRRDDLAVTRFYTSALIRNRMFEMEAFDTALRDAIESAEEHHGDGSVQFIRRSSDGTVVPCSPNKILVSTVRALRPFRRILPIGFQSRYKSYIERTIESLDAQLEALTPFSAAAPVEIPLETAIELLNTIEQTLEWIDEEEDAPPFDWVSAKSALTHLSGQHPNPSARGNVLLWTARNRNINRLAATGSHSVYAETPDSPKTEGALTRAYAIDTPILFLLRQNGDEDKNWRGTPFYWPVIQAQANTPTSIYTAETSD
tara:strand:+ start:54131 stop:56317 length:2187 start_codon:yes stop_codon:yes gene_type:complete